MELFRVGDTVSWCGKVGVVESVGAYDLEYPLKVRFGNAHYVYFTSDGKSREEYRQPSLVNLTLKESK